MYWLYFLIENVALEAPGLLKWVLVIIISWYFWCWKQCFKKMTVKENISLEILKYLMKNGLEYALSSYVNNFEKYQKNFSAAIRQCFHVCHGKLSWRTLVNQKLYLQKTLHIAITKKSWVRNKAKFFTQNINKLLITDVVAYLISNC